MAMVGQPLHDSPQVGLTRVTCDGVDPARLQAEATSRDSIVVVLRGAFELRTERRTMVDPTVAFVLRKGSEHIFTHPCGCGDVCLSVHGPLASQLADAGPLFRSVSAESSIRLRALQADDLETLEL